MAGVSPTFPGKSPRSGSAIFVADPPLSCVLVSRREGMPRKIERTREGPHTLGVLLHVMHA